MVPAPECRWRVAGRVIEHAVSIDGRNDDADFTVRNHGPADHHAGWVGSERRLPERHRPEVGDRNGIDEAGLERGRRRVEVDMGMELGSQILRVCGELTEVFIRHV